jgi:hypothetical protein
MVLVMIFTGLDPEVLAEPSGNGYWRWPAQSKDGVASSSSWMSPSGASTDRRRNPWQAFGPVMRGVTLDVLREADALKRLTADDIVARIGDGGELANEIASFRRSWLKGGVGRARDDSNEDDDDEAALLGGGGGGRASNAATTGTLDRAYVTVCDGLFFIAGRVEEACVIM